MKTLGAPSEAISAAEAKMSVQFPEGLKAVWRISNGLELPEGWRLYPVFDSKEPKKTCNDIVYENTKGRWSYMDLSLVAIATDDTGDQLVLQRQGSVLNEAIMLWHHEQNRTTAWEKDFGSIVQLANQRAEKIARQMSKGQGKRK